VEVALQARPAWPEIAGVLTVCLAVFVLLVALDGAASRGETARARKALAARAAASRHNVRRVATRDDSLGGAGPISVPVGSAWSPGTAPAVGHAKVVERARLRRIIGAVAAPVTAAAEVSARSGSGLPSSLFALIAGCGVIMALAGSALLARSPR
jgi:hypothetical protein